MKRLVVAPEAENDLATAYDWYERQRPGLGSDFLIALRETVERVRDEPTSFPVVHRRMRRALPGRFPYQVLFRDDPDAVVVIAFFHAKRDPRVWKTRRRGESR